jgi:hypothetical protein
MANVLTGPVATPPTGAAGVSQEFRKAWEIFFKAVDQLIYRRISHHRKYEGEFRMRFADDLHAELEAITDSRFLSWLESQCLRYALFGGQRRIHEIRMLASEMQMHAAAASPAVAHAATDAELAEDAEVIKGSIEKFIGKVVTGLFSFILGGLNHRKYKERTKSALEILNEALKIFGKT